MTRFTGMLLLTYELDKALGKQGNVEKMHDSIIVEYEDHAFQISSEEWGVYLIEIFVVDDPWNRTGVYERVCVIDESKFEDDEDVVRAIRAGLMEQKLRKD